MTADLADNPLKGLDFSGLFRPTSEASGLPGACYIDPEIHRWEQRKLFAEGWPAVAVASEIPKAGDYLPVWVAGQPILILRDRQGQVRAFHNICRHRGVVLAEKPGHGAATIRCPYHSWAYGLDGALLRTPDAGGHGVDAAPGLDRATLGLIPVRLAQWGDAIFVNLSGTAPDFADWVAPLARRWAGFDLGLLRHAAALDFEVAANWKLAIENAVEFYHLPWVHPDLNSYSATDVHYFVNAGDRFAGTASADYRPGARGGAVLPSFPGLDEAQTRRAEYPILFPNLHVGLMADHMFFHILTPDGPGRHRQRLHLYVIGAEGLTPAMAPARDELAQRWRAINAEDIGLVEAMQRGRGADAFDGGRFSAVQDYATHFFQRAVAGAMGVAPPAGAARFSGAKERTAPVRFSA